MLWIDHLQSRLQEHSQIHTDDIQESLVQAFNEYSGYHQYTQTHDITSTGENIVSLSSSWVQGYSRIENIEYPLTEVLMDSNPEGYPIPAYQEPSGYNIQTISNEQKLVILFNFPIDSVLRVHYFIPYTIHLAAYVPHHHRGAILNLATSYALAKLSAVYSQSIRYDIEADAVDYKGRASEYLKQASWYRDLWEKNLGIGKYASEDTDFGQDIDEDTTGYIASKTLEVDRQSRLFRPSYERKAYNNPLYT